MSLRIEGGEVAAFMAVTPLAGESKVINGRLTAVLFCDHVIDFMREEGDFSGEQAIFATVFCALDDLPTQGRRDVGHATLAPAR